MKKTNPRFQLKTGIWNIAIEMIILQKLSKVCGLLQQSGLYP